MSDWLKLFKNVATRTNRVVAILVVGLGVLVWYLQPEINNLINGVKFERVAEVGSLDPCRPSNLADLVDKGFMTCEDLPAAGKSALLHLRKGVEVSFDAPPKTFISKPAIRTQIFLAHGGTAFSIRLRDEHGGELEIVDNFERTDPDDDEPTGTGNLKLSWCAHGGSACETLAPSDQNGALSGYRIFSAPDYLALGAVIDGGFATIESQLVQSYEDHRSRTSIDPMASIAFRYRRQAPQLGKIVSIRFGGVSDETRIRIEALELLDDSPTIALHGKATVPKGVSPEDILIHLEAFGSRGLGKDVATARALSDGSFAVPARPGEYEVWAEVRSPAGQLLTGSCAVSITTATDNPWITFHPRTKLPRAKRSERKLCEQGNIALVPSAEKDQIRR